MKEDILKFIFIIAMRDATLQKSYNGNKKELTDIDKYINSKTNLTIFLNDIISGKIKSEVEYDKRFLELAHTICNEINSISKNKEFKFGNAQKLINIMTKYLYINVYVDKNIKDNFKFCHCPMDSIMLKHVWKKRNELQEETQKKLEKANNFLKSWGKEDFENNNCPKRYMAFQYAIKELSKKEDLNCIEYDYHIWN